MSTGWVRFAFAAFLVAPGPLVGQHVVPLDPELPTQGRLILSAGVDVAHEDCPTSALQFSLDAGEDSDWTGDNLVGWEVEQIIRVVRQTMKKARADLPGPAFDLCLGLAARVDDPTLDRMGGIGGAAFPPTTVLLLVAPAINPAWLEELPGTIAHEYHHIATPRRAVTGLDIMVREGRAHYFAAELLPHLLHPSAQALDPSQVASSWQTIREALSTPPGAFLRRYMFGGEYFGGEVPRWAGYTLGYCLVRMYGEDHPNLSHLELANVSAQDFVQEQVHCPRREASP